MEITYLDESHAPVEGDCPGIALHDRQFERSLRPLDHGSEQCLRCTASPRRRMNPHRHQLCVVAAIPPNESSNVAIEFGEERSTIGASRTALGSMVPLVIGAARLILVRPSKRRRCVSQCGQSDALQKQAVIGSNATNVQIHRSSVTCPNRTRPHYFSEPTTHMA